MSSTPFVAPLELLIRPSRIIASLLSAMHAMAILVCAPLPMPMAYRSALLLAVLSAFFWNAYIYMRRTPRRLNWSPEEGWRWMERGGTEHVLELLPQAYLSNWLVIAHFRDEQGKRRTAMLAQDSVNAEGFRRLKVLLRYGTPKA